MDVNEVRLRGGRVTSGWPRQTFRPAGERETYEFTFGVLADRELVPVTVKGVSRDQVAGIDKAMYPDADVMVHGRLTHEPINGRAHVEAVTVDVLRESGAMFRVYDQTREGGVRAGGDFAHGEGTIAHKGAKTVNLGEIARWLRGEAKNGTDLDEFDYFADILDQVANGELGVAR